MAKWFYVLKHVCQRLSLVSFSLKQCHVIFYHEESWLMQYDPVWLLRMLPEILQLVNEISSFLEVIYKKGVLKIFTKFKNKYNSSHLEVLCQKDVFKNYGKFAGKHLCWSPFLIKLSTWRPAALFERDFSTGVFALCETCKIFRRAFL